MSDAPHHHRGHGHGHSHDHPHPHAHTQAAAPRPAAAVHPRLRRALAGGLLLLLLLAYLASGVFVVRPNEVGVVRLFGKVVSTEIGGVATPRLYPPGLHCRAPAPFSRLDRVRPDETQTVAVGFDQMDAILGRAGDPARAQFLTGDQNLMELRLTVQYTVADPVGMLLRSAAPATLLACEAESCLTRAVADLGVDALLGAGRVLVATRVREHLEREVGAHGLGLRVTAVNFQAPTPPQAVADAFNEVQSATAEKRRRVLEAEAYRNGVVTRAEGDADRVRLEASAYAEERVARAEGEAKRFGDMYAEYRQARDVTALRLYVETMETILPEMKKVFVGAEETGAPVDLGLFQGRQ